MTAFSAQRYPLSTARPCRIPGGMRTYAIGDIHGRADLLAGMLDLIRHDAADTEYQLVFLGDYIDRGPDSRRVIELLLQLQLPATFLLGNHEQVMRDVLRYNDIGLAMAWQHQGGLATLASYGVRPASAEDDAQRMITELRATVPSEHYDFIKALKSHLTIGDYFFCHAGVRPGVMLEQQTTRDLVWIRRDFLPHTDPYEKMIVHGHTITEQAVAHPNRIGIDTGAYATGWLTALALEEDRQWLLQTRP